jgi:hypothetical protein
MCLITLECLKCETSGLSWKNVVLCETRLDPFFLASENISKEMYEMYIMYEMYDIKNGSLVLEQIEPLF